MVPQYISDLIQFIFADHGIFRPFKKVEELVERNVAAVRIGSRSVPDEHKPFRFQNLGKYLLISLYNTIFSTVTDFGSMTLLGSCLTMIILNV